MAVKKCDVVLMGKNSSGDTTLNMPVTRLRNIEDDAEIKENPTEGDFIPIIDMADGGQMKKTPYSAPLGESGVSAVYNPNLLDNPDFKVNQRGQQIYSSTTMNLSSLSNISFSAILDRWKSGLYTSNQNRRYGSVKLLDTGNISLTAQEDSTLFFRQYLTKEIMSYISGKNVTLSFEHSCLTFQSKGVVYKVSSVSGLIGDSGMVNADNQLIFTSANVGSNYRPPNNNGGLIYNNGGTISGKLAKDNNGYYIELGWRKNRVPNVSSDISGTISESVIINWIKLELGETATPFIPPDPALELLKCQRYYINTFSEVNGYYTFALNQATQGTIPVNVRFPVKMRSIPSIIIGHNGKGTRYNKVVGNLLTGFSYNEITNAEALNVSAVGFPCLNSIVENQSQTWPEGLYMFHYEANAEI